MFSFYCQKNNSRILQSQRGKVFGYQENTQNFLCNDFSFLLIIFQVIYKETKEFETKERIVNMDLLTCTCLRKNYYGFSCSHIFAVLIYQKENILDILPKLIYDRWKITPQNFSAPSLQEVGFLQRKFFITPSKKKVIKSKALEKKSKKVVQKSKLEGTELELIEIVESKELFSVQTPPKGKNPFMTYMNEKKGEFKEKFPNLRWTQLISKIAETYKTLSSDERNEYKIKAEELVKNSGTPKQRRFKEIEIDVRKSIKKVKLSKKT